MLRALRRSRHTFWLAVLALLTTLPGSLQTWHDVGDDPLCNPTVVVHDHTAHRVGPETASSDSPDHCAVCHWFQTLRGATQGHAFTPPHRTPALPSRVAPVDAIAGIVEAPPGRAPPLT